MFSSIPIATEFSGLAQIDPSILVFSRGGEEEATGVYKSYMTVAKDDANKAENQKTKGIERIFIFTSQQTPMPLNVFQLKDA